MPRDRPHLECRRPAGRGRLGPASTRAGFLSVDPLFCSGASSHPVDDPHEEQLPRLAGDGEEEGPVQHEVDLVLLQRRRLIRLDHGVGHPLTALLVDSHPGGVGGLGDIGVYPLPQHGGEVGQGGVEHIGDPQRLQPADQVGLGGHVELGQGQVYL